MKYDTLKALVNAKVYENTEQEITGGDMNNVLQSAIASLGAHYQMGGLVSPNDKITVGDEPVVFLATTPGTYTYFGGIVVADGEVALLVWSGTAWSKQTPDIATRTEVSQLGQEFNEIVLGEVEAQTASINIVSGQGIGLNTFSPNINLESSKIYKVTITGDRSNGTIFHMYLYGSDSGQNFKWADYPFIVDDEQETDYFTVNPSRTNVYIKPSGNVDTIKFYAQGTNIKDTGEIGFSFEEYGVVGLEERMDDLNVDVNGGNVNKELFWADGWINTLGKITASLATSASKFTQPFLLKKGETVTVGTNNANICIIGTTTADSLSLNDTITVLQTTSYSERFETHTYTATEDIKIVLCVRWEGHTLSITRSSLYDELMELQESLENVESNAEAERDIIITQNLDVLGKTAGEINATRGLGLSPATAFFYIKAKAGKTIGLSYSYSAGVYSGSENINAYFYYSDGTASSYREIKSDREKQYTLEKDLVKIALYTSTAASVDGTVTVHVTIPDIYEIPDYYNTDNYLLNKKNRIEELAVGRSGNADLFIFMTDEHWERNAKHALALLRYLSTNLNVYKCLSGGDSGHQMANIEFGKARKEAFRHKVLPCIGNHEYLVYYTQSNQYSPISLENRCAYAYLMDNDSFIGNILRGYYYYDDIERKIRYIVLNAYKPKPQEQISSGYRIIAEWGYEQAQCDWLENVALNVETGWNIIVITHNIAAYSHVNDYLVPSIPSVLSAPEGPEPVCEILLRYNGSGNIMFVLAGHTHSDGLILLNDELVGITENKTGKTVPVIVSACDAYNFDDIPGEELQDRDPGTVNEQAFDLDIADYLNKKLHCVRIGAPAAIDFPIGKPGALQERIVNYEQKTVTVGGTITLTSGLSGSITWDSADTSIATVDSSGVVTGVAEGSVFVNAIDSTNNISATFIVKVNP